MYADFRDRLKSLRKETGITQKDLAALMDMGATTIANYESGKDQPSFDVINFLADHFYVSVDYLIGYSEIRNPYTANLALADENFIDTYPSLSIKTICGFMVLF